MRMLGVRTSLSAFRWDLVYLLAQLLADTRPGVAEIAAPVQAVLTKLKEERDALEAAEDALIIASALLHKKDKHRDAVLIEVGGVVRASDKAVYKVLFGKYRPSTITRLAVEAESAEMSRIVGEIGKLPDDHPVRTHYLPELTEAEAGVKAAGTQSDEAVTSLALQRSQLDRFKLEADQVRLTAHGLLVTLLKDKAEADSFFRPTSSSPGAKDENDEATTPADPQPPPATPPA